MLCPILDDDGCRSSPCTMWSISIYDIPQLSGQILKPLTDACHSGWSNMWLLHASCDLVQLCQAPGSKQCCQACHTQHHRPWQEMCSGCHCSTRPIQKSNLYITRSRLNLLNTEQCSPFILQDYHCRLIVLAPSHEHAATSCCCACSQHHALPVLLRGGLLSPGSRI